MRNNESEHCCPSTFPQPPRPLDPHHMLDRVIKPINTFLSQYAVVPYAYNFGPVESGDSKRRHPANTGGVIWLTTGIWWGTCEQLMRFCLWRLRLQSCLDDIERGHYRKQSELKLRGESQRSKSDLSREGLCLLVIAVRSEPVPAATSLACKGSMAVQPSEAVSVVVVVPGQGRMTCAPPAAESIFHPPGRKSPKPNDVSDQWIVNQPRR